MLCRSLFCLDQELGLGLVQLGLELSGGLFCGLFLLDELGLGCDELGIGCNKARIETRIGALRWSFLLDEFGLGFLKLGIGFVELGLKLCGKILVLDQSSFKPGDSLYGRLLMVGESNIFRRRT